MDKKYLNVNQCAEVLGRSESALRNLCSRRKIPHRKAGGRLIFIAHEIECWIERGEGVTLDELIKH
jgi:predicted DNA-binding transcriptional regulator AlpA